MAKEAQVVNNPDGSSLSCSICRGRPDPCFISELSYTGNNTSKLHQQLFLQQMFSTGKQLNPSHARPICLPRPRGLTH